MEIEQNGFASSEVRAIKIMRIPRNIALSYCKTATRDWPWYVYGRKFFEKIGAQFRTIDEKQEMLLDDVVYSVEDYVPCGISRERTIGKRAISELNSEPELSAYPYHEEDTWEPPVVHLITCLGMCLATCQLIEHYIAQSFLLGISKKQKQQYRTLRDLREGWKKKTLGNMLKCIEEAWEIESTFKVNLELFLAHRNLLVHGITTNERYDIRTHWGREELIAFLSFFDIHARIVKSAFRASYYASIEFGLKHFGRPKGIPKRVFTRKQRDEASLFFVFFTPRDGAI